MRSINLSKACQGFRYLSLVLLVCIAQQSLLSDCYAKGRGDGRGHSPKPAKNAVPLKGTLRAHEISEVQFPLLFVEGDGSGRASHLGRFTVTYEYEVDLLTLVGIGPAHYVAANGDRLYTEVSGQGYPTGHPDISFIVETQTIVGGTGRFKGARGEFTVHRLLNTATGNTVGKFRGMIVKH